MKLPSHEVHPRRFSPAKPARRARLYHQYAETEPIFDYHCHLSPRDIAENRQFKNLFEIWLKGDHYKWRAMRANGVAERYCTGEAKPFEKFQAWAAHGAAHAAQPALPLDAPGAEALLRHRRAARREAARRASGRRPTSNWPRRN